MTYSHKSMASATTHRHTLILRAGPGRRERRRAETHERIFRAALQLFAQRGFMETTVEDITEAADVGKGTFFNYFPTKEHVLATFGTERLAAVERALERAKRGPVLPVLRELLVDFAGQANENPALLRAIYAAHASCAPVRVELQQRIRAGRRLLARIFSLAQKRAEVRRDISPQELARLTQMAFLGVAVAWCLNPESPARGTGGAVWELFYEGLRPKKMAGPRRIVESRAARNSSKRG
jgi:AcrR family transcriptional regulator